MQLAHRWADRNLTRLELVLALIVLLLLIGTFARHVLAIFSMAEMRMVDSTIINLNSSLKYHAAIAVMRGDHDELIRLRDRSPIRRVQSLQESYTEIEENVDLLAMTAEFPVFSRQMNYIGEFSNPDTDLVAKGQWYFDIDKKHLNYRVVNSGLFANDLNESGTISFAVIIDYVDRNRSRQYDPQIDQFVTINVKSVNGPDSL